MLDDCLPMFIIEGPCHPVFRDRRDLFELDQHGLRVEPSGQNPVQDLRQLHSAGFADPVAHDRHRALILGRHDSVGETAPSLDGIAIIGLHGGGCSCRNGEKPSNKQKAFHDPGA
jgi:hypothetical protein